MMRALLLDSPDDPGAWLADLEYRLGTDLLVAPMIDPSGQRQVYLPAGQWVDWWSGAVLDGGGYRPVRRPLEQLPLFVRYGALLPVTEPGDAVGDAPFAAVTLQSWGAGTAALTLSDTDGDTTVRAVRDGGDFAVTLDGPARVDRIEFAAVDGARLPATVTVNGRPAALATRERPAGGERLVETSGPPGTGWAGPDGGPVVDGQPGHSSSGYDFPGAVSPVSP